MIENPEFNLPLLRKAVEWAESEARKPVKESEWFQPLYATSGEGLGRTCGTAYCIAGYVAAQDGGHRITETCIDNDGSARVAQRLLGIDHEDAWGGSSPYISGLFQSSNNIEDVRKIAGRIARKYGEEL